MTELTLEALRAELEPLKADIAAMRIRTDGLGRCLASAVDILRRETRLLKAAINDMGRTNITAGEVEARLDRVEARLDRIEQRLNLVEAP